VMLIGILWVTRPADNDIYAAFNDLVFGFARCIRLEKPGLKFVVLQLEAHSLSLTSIARVFEHAFIRNPGVLESDVDYRELNGCIQIPRLVPDETLRQYLATSKSNTKAKEMRTAPDSSTSSNGTSICAVGSYIIVGGTRGIGRSLARWLIEKGAKDIILASRSGEINVNLVDVLATASAANARIRVVDCDVSSLEEVKKTVAAAAPVRGIIHSAMVLRTSAFADATLDGWQDISNPKVKGVLNLHIALQDQPLDFFICLSSLIGIVGYPNESIYGASNAFVDALCRLRGSQGLPAASISLPAISDVGYVAEYISGGDRKRTNNKFGFSMTGAQVNLAVEAACEKELFNPANENHTSVGIAVTPELMAKATFLKTPLLAHIRKIYCERLADPKISVITLSSIKDILGQETDYQRSSQVVARAIIHKITSMHNLGPLANEVVLERRLTDLPFDSLNAVKFRDWIQTNLDANLSLLDLVGSDSMRHLVAKIMRLSTYVIAKDDAPAPTGNAEETTFKV
jgi:hypothetical protein